MGIRPYHNAIVAAAGYWRSAVAESGGVDSGKLDVFAETLSAALARIYDSAEGIILICSEMSGDQRLGGMTVKKSRTSSYLLYALKKAKLPATALPPDIVMAISISEVKACRYIPGEAARPQFLWRK